jgi:uncharacterized protein YuzE
MKISYDAEVDALSITFHETTVTTKHLIAIASQRKILGAGQYEMSFAIRERVSPRIMTA